jgi:hypothetical protein
MPGRMPCINGLADASPLRGADQGTGGVRVVEVRLPGAVPDRPYVAGQVSRGVQAEPGEG